MHCHFKYLDEITKVGFNKLDIRTTTLMNIKEVLDSKMIFLKLVGYKLLFSETLNFVKYNSINSHLLSFIPILSNVGIVLYLSPLGFAKMSLKTIQEKSAIFTMDFLKLKKMLFVLNKRK